MSIQLDDAVVCDGCECELCLENAHVSKRGLMCDECNTAYKSYDALISGEISAYQHMLDCVSRGGV